MISAAQLQALQVQALQNVRHDPGNRQIAQLSSSVAPCHLAGAEAVKKQSSSYAPALLHTGDCWYSVTR
jgi:hypothetical protein